MEGAPYVSIVGRAFRPAASEHFPEQAPQLLAAADVQRARTPLLEIELLRFGEILLEVGQQPGGKRAVEDGDIQLVVQLQRPVVEVRGSDNAQDTVDDHDL